MSKGLDQRLFLNACEVYCEHNDWDVDKHSCQPKALRAAIEFYLRHIERFDSPKLYMHGSMTTHSINAEGDRHTTIEPIAIGDGRLFESVISYAEPASNYAIHGNDDVVSVEEIKEVFGKYNISTQIEDGIK